MRRNVWSAADRRAFGDGVRDRAHAVPGRRADGPTANEWDDDAFPALVACTVCGERWPAPVLDNAGRCPICCAAAVHGCCDTTVGSLP